MNTLPGFTATSMYPKQAELAGIGFRELIARLVDLALEDDR
jgi:D-alanine-D-alanine ligase